MTTLSRTRDIGASRAERSYETLTATQWLSPHQLRELQDEKLRRLIRHAYRSVPYYRVRMMDLQLHPEDIRSQDDLSKLPLLTKADVRRHLYFDIMQEGASQKGRQRRCCYSLARSPRAALSGIDPKPYCRTGSS